MRMEWLTEQDTIENIERADFEFRAALHGKREYTTSSREHYFEGKPYSFYDDKPFGMDYFRWERLKAKMRPGDELWKFCSSDKSWEMMIGRRGIALVREVSFFGRRRKKIVACIVTIMN